MRIFKFLLSLALTLIIVYALNTPSTATGEFLPAIGKLINPFTGFWQNAEHTGKPKKDNNQLDTKATVKVIYDDRFIPHIFAQNDRDAMYMQGYLLAKHRLWQMDFSTRAASGRLSEILGKRTLEYDRQKLRKGMLFAAKNALKEWEKDEKHFELLEAYAAGANAYIKALQPKDYPIEFKLLGYEPEEWTPLKTAIFIKSMAESLCARENDLEATNALKVLGKETFDFLFPEHFEGESPIIPPSVKYDFQTKIKKEKIQLPIGSIDYPLLPKQHPHNGSNNWAVTASKTANGNPILCGDPHLNLSLPSIWFEMQIHTPEYNVYGVTLPGMPGIIIGFNEHIAWSMTNVAHDVMDWYTIKWADASKQTYIIDGQDKKVNEVIEKIKVRGGETVVDTVKYTEWGPIVYTSNKDGYEDMALRWIAHDVVSLGEVAVFSKLNKAKNYDDYVDALEAYIAPAQNFAFASKDDDIALRVNGFLPIKRSQQGRFVQDGSQSKNAWQGFIPKSQIPAVKNPPRGFVASANQRSTTPNYPYYYNAANFEEYRGRILNRELSKMENITIQDMMDLQNSNYDLKAEEALPMLLWQLRTDILTEEEEKYLTTLKLWDYNYERGERAAVLFSIWYKKFYELTWDEIYAIKVPTLFPKSRRTINLLEEDPKHKFFDVLKTERVETAMEVVTLAFKLMVKEARKLQDKEGELLDWGTYKSSTIRHLARLEPFSRNIYSNGTYSALNAHSKTHGPSWKMIVEFGEEVNAWVTYPGGTSGNPGSPYYDNFIENWNEGKYYKARFFKNASDLKDKVMRIQAF